MHVADPCGSQFCPQGLLAELRVMSRPGNTAYIYDALDAVRPQKLEEFFPCVGRMPDRQDGGHFDVDFSHGESPFPPIPWKSTKVERPATRTHWECRPGHNFYTEVGL